MLFCLLLMTILTSINDFFQKYYPESPLRILVAVSGGADSVALLHALTVYQSQFPRVSLEVAHLNHAIRGETADQDARYVADLCQKLGAPLHTRTIDVPNFAARYRLTLEEAARLARYTFLAEIAGQTNFNLVVTAHTANDQAETVLLHLLRGSGLSGLTGIAPLSPLPLPDKRFWQADEQTLLVLKQVKLGRPLLAVGREEIEAYCAENALQPRTDETNTDQNYRRNRIRHTLLPLLEQDYQTGVRENLARLAAILRDEATWLEELTEQAFAANTCVLAYPARVEFATAWLNPQPQALQRRLLRRAYLALNGDLQGLEFKHMAMALEYLSQNKAFSAKDLPKGIMIEGNTKTVALISKASLRQLKKLEPLKLNLTNFTEWAGWRFETKILPYSEMPGVISYQNTTDKIELWLDFEQTGENLWLRGRKAGEKVHLTGAKGSRKVQDIMLDARILPSLRDLSPLIVSISPQVDPVSDSAQTIVALVEIGVAQAYRVTGATKQVLHLVVERK